MEIVRCSDLTYMSKTAAHIIGDIARRTVCLQGWWSIALCGGTTPRHVYKRLGSSEYADAVAWGNTHIFWGDERCVPPTHKASNYRMAWELFLSRVAIPKSNVHRIRGECLSAEQAAWCYEEEMRALFCARKGGIVDGFPVFDLIMLGIGADGHTASLFPGSVALEEKERWVRAVFAPQGYEPLPRITLTLPVINNARTVLFLVTGAKKESVVRNILGNPAAACIHYPAARVCARERTLWVVDTETIRI